MTPAQKKANVARLKKLHSRAESIRRKHPGKKYAKALKEAGAEMRAGKIRSPKKRTMLAKRKAAPRHKARARPRSRKRIGESGVSTKSRTHTDYNRNKVNITVGSVNKDKKKARDKLEYLIGKETVKQFKAKRKPLKKKIGKKINRMKSEYRRLAI